jgi:hypothetical protein
LQSFRRTKTSPLNDDITTNLDLPFEAIQISQIIILDCELLRDRISEGSRENAIEIVDSISKHAIRIGKMMQKMRKK